MKENGIVKEEDLGREIIYLSVFDRSTKTNSTVMHTIYVSSSPPA